MILRRFAILALLSVWLTASQHCGLEVAGVWDALAKGLSSSCCETVAANDFDCTHDGCGVVESSSVAASSSTVKVPGPQLLEGPGFLLVVVVPLPAVEAPPVYATIVDRPLDWVPSWHLERRAAQSPRAPSSIPA